MQGYHNHPLTPVTETLLKLTERCFFDPSFSEILIALRMQVEHDLQHGRPLNALREITRTQTGLIVQNISLLARRVGSASRQLVTQAPLASVVIALGLGMLLAYAMISQGARSGPAPTPTQTPVVTPEHIAVSRPALGRYVAPDRIGRGAWPAVTGAKTFSAAVAATSPALSPSDQQQPLAAASRPAEPGPAEAGATAPATSEPASPAASVAATARLAAAIAIATAQPTPVAPGIVVTLAPIGTPLVAPPADNRSAATSTPTRTAPPTSTPTRTAPPTHTARPTSTPTRTAAPTSTSTRTATPTHTARPTSTPTRTVTPILWPSDVPSSTATISPTSTATTTASSTSTASATASPTDTATTTATASATASPTDTATTTASSTSTATASASPTDTATATATASATASPTETATATTGATASPTDTVTATASASPTDTIAATATVSPTPSATPTASPTPCADGRGDLDIILALDTSYSITADTLAAVRDATTGFVDQMEARSDHHEIGLVAFNGNATLRHPLDDDYAGLRQALSELAIGEGTNLVAALEVARTTLLQEGDGDQQVIILLSDGRSAGRGDVVRQHAEAIKKQGILIVTVGFGTDVNAPLMERVASEGYAHYAPETDDLGPVYLQIGGRLDCDEGD